MISFGEMIRKLREEKGLPLRTVAAALDMDVAILSKIEHGHRKPNREQVLRMAEYLGATEENLLVAWLSDKVMYALEDETLALKALQAAEEKVEYLKFKKTDRNAVINKIKDFLQKDERVAKAWIFGSFARAEHTPESDIDLMVRFKEPEKISLFDYADIAYCLEQEINIKVDLVEEGCIEDFAWQSAQHDLKLIYG